MILIVFSWLLSASFLGTVFFLSSQPPHYWQEHQGSVMESCLYFLLLLSLVLKISRTENINTTPPSQDLEEQFLESGDSHIENLTIQLSVEPLPQPSPLIGTFPHDFQLLPSTISRRSSFHRTEGHNYEEQGEENKEISLFFSVILQQ